jgi:uncharacterized protein YbjT (DUF2867 family)
MSDSILIIGATGSVGYEVAKRLNELNIRTKIAVRNPDKAIASGLENVDYIQFNYLEHSTFKDAFDGIDKVVLVSPPSYLQLQEHVIKAVDEAVNSGVKTIVNISAISIESDLDKPMKEIEDHIRKSTVDAVFLRPNCYMQNFKDLFRDLIIEENQIIVPAENAKSCFIDVRDVAEVAVKALTDESMKNQTFKLTGKQQLNMHVVAHMFSENLNKEIEYIDVAENLFEKRLRNAGWPEGTIVGTLQLCSHIKNGTTAQLTNDLERLLGREPIRFEQFIKDYSDNWS